MFTNTVSPQCVYPSCVYRLLPNTFVYDSVLAVKSWATLLCLKTKVKKKKGRRKERRKERKKGQECAARFVSVSGWGPGVSGSQAAYARLCCGFLHHSHYAQPQPSTALRYRAPRSLEPPGNNLVISNYSYISTRASLAQRDPFYPKITFMTILFSAE